MSAGTWIEMLIIVPGVILFSAILITTYWPGRREAIERNSQIPFHDKT
ncbi:MAG: cbb3-type cytochrome c oxidase subunit 3 [Rhodospirillales bacterium]|jgi:cbb3-type cytochrome oxidase subunit 3|nr:cbb3-type cytochrome c oxidase subunit 3 [Rhodospirillales bacterium]